MIDCLVIGGGLAGLLSATYLARYRRRACVIDAGDSRAALIPATHNYPGFAGIEGEQLLQRLRVQHRDTALICGPTGLRCCAKTVMHSPLLVRAEVKSRARLLYWLPVWL